MPVKFIPSGRGKARNPPDPAYPMGKVITPELPEGTPTCTFDLPYPAPECGYFSVLCDRCGTTVLITAAGRPDDPICVTVPCLNLKEKLDAAHRE